MSPPEDVVALQHEMASSAPRHKARALQQAQASGKIGQAGAEDLGPRLSRRQQRRLIVRLYDFGLVIIAAAGLAAAIALIVASQVG
jgi:hypothetical protein